MDGVFVKMRLFADVATACQTGSTSKGCAVDRKVAVGILWESDASGRNPPLLLQRTCHLPHFVRHVHNYVACGSWRCAPAVL